jgi:hypothetical protein
MSQKQGFSHNLRAHRLTARQVARIIGRKARGTGPRRTI